MTGGQEIVSAVGLGNIVVWAFFAGRQVQLIRDIEMRVGKLEALMYKRRRTDFPELVVNRAADSLRASRAGRG